MYAKIDEQGNVVEFPYITDRLGGAKEFRDIPADAVEVDTTSLRPAVSWNQKLMHDAVIKNEDGTYALTFTTEVKFSTFEDKQKWMKIAITQNKKQNENIFKSKVAQIKAGYPEEETISWDQQAKEAALYLLDKNAYVPLIDNMSKNRNTTLLELSTRIVEKTNLYANAYGTILGIYQKNNDILGSIDIEDETTFDNIDAYGWI